MGALAVALAVAGCSKNTGSEDNDSSEVQTQAATLAKNSDGPAPDVPGAKKGGTILMYEGGDFEHLDPQRNYVVPAQAAGSALLYRTLTTYRENGDGKLEVVGDLATNTGEESNGGKTWTYKLKDNLKYEDGTPITSQDIAYGIARSFSPELSEGPHYMQQWLAGNDAYNDKYKGPYNNASKLPPGTTTPDAKTIVFTFSEPRPDMPFAGALPTSAPVPPAKDTKASYDNRVFSSGPYKIKSYVRGQKLTLVRNTAWDPNSDPARHQFPDSYVVDFTRNADQATNLIIADRGVDQAAFVPQDMAIPASLYPKVIATDSVKKRMLRGPTQFVWQLNMNTQKIKDLKVRQALNYALDKEGFLKVWGSYLGEPASTILSPTTSGYEKYNAYDGGKNGDPAKAKELLGNKRIKLSYAYRNTPRNQQIAAFLTNDLKRSGIDITTSPIDKDQYYTQIGKKNTPFDLYISGWGSDWPGASTVIPPLFDGARITPEGNNNYSYLNEPAVNKRIDEILVETDLTKAAGDWAKLDKEILEKYAPVVPILYDTQATMFGSKVGGGYLSLPYGTMGMNNMFVK